jgi:N-acetyltransferase
LKMRALFKPLTGSHVQLRPSVTADLQPLFELGKDPEIWAIHRHKNRGERGKFESFFLSGFSNPLGVYTIIHRWTGEILGTTRYYRFEPEEPAVHIGYTFLGKRFWGTGVNAEVKGLMLNNAFRSVETVYFDVFEENIRSHKAVLKLGARLREIRDDHYIYQVSRAMWDKIRNFRERFTAEEPGKKSVPKDSFTYITAPEMLKMHCPRWPHIRS